MSLCNRAIVSSCHHLSHHVIIYVIMAFVYRVFVSSCHHFIIYVIIASFQVAKFWLVLAVFDNFCKQLETIDYFRQDLATFDNFWPVASAVHQYSHGAKT